jgi:hypothetical protein
MTSEIFRTREQEPLPSWCTVEVAALRPNSEPAAAELRRSLPVVLAGIVDEVPEAELELGMFTDEDGIVRIQISASAGASTEAVTREIAAALEPVAETAVSMERPTDGEGWPVVADARHDRLGFAAGCTDVAPKCVPWQQGDNAPSAQLIEDLASMPGHGVRVRLRAAARLTEPRWEVQLNVITDGAEPSLRLRSGLRRRFTGLQVAAYCEDEAVWLQVSSADLPCVFAVPVAKAEPLAGARTAPAAPIPVSPPRHRVESEVGIRIGHAVTGGGRPVSIELTASERLRHVHVLGRTGTGKSSALAGIVHDLAARGEGALIADPHGTLCERILAELPDEARERVWVIRCGDVDNPVPINPLAEADPVRRDIAIAELCATFQYLFDKKETGIVGPRFSERVAMTLRALSAAHGMRASLLDVPSASTDDDFMSAAVALSKDDRLKTWWRTNKMESRSAEHGQVLAWVNSKFDAFSNTAAMRAVLGSGANAIDFTDAMDQGQIILVDLSKAELGEAASRLLGYLYLSRVWEAALRRERRDVPFTVIVDEAHTLIAGALTNMLAEGRKFGLSVMLAHQYLEQLDDDLRPAVDGNVATTIAFRCAVGDAVEIHKRFGGLVDTSVLVTLPDLTAVSLRTAMSGPAYPHTLIVDHNDRVEARHGDALVEHRQAVLGATHADLVDPHRELTAAAAAGVSNIKALPIKRRPSRPVAPRPGLAGDDQKRDGAAPSAVRSRAQSASLLDEWMAKRAKLAERKDDEDRQLAIPMDGDVDEYDSLGA